MKNQAAQELGKLGGKAGTGKSKVRGDAEYYRQNALKAHIARKKNKEARSQ